MSGASEFRLNKLELEHQESLSRRKSGVETVTELDLRDGPIGIFLLFDGMAVVVRVFIWWGNV